MKGKHYLLWEILRGLLNLGWELKKFPKWRLGIAFLEIPWVCVCFKKEDKSEHVSQRKLYCLRKETYHLEKPNSKQMNKQKQNEKWTWNTVSKK